MWNANSLKVRGRRKTPHSLRLSLQSAAQLSGSQVTEQSTTIMEKTLAGDFDAQTHQAFKLLTATLSEVGGKLADIVGYDRVYTRCQIW